MIFGFPFFHRTSGMNIPALLGSFHRRSDMAIRLGRILFPNTLTSCVSSSRANHFSGANLGSDSFAWRYVGCTPMKFPSSNFYSTNTTTAQHELDEMNSNIDVRDNEETFMNDRTLINRQNKKWLTKKNKNYKKVKVLPDYKEINNSTYGELLLSFPQLENFDINEAKMLMAEAAFYGLSPTKAAKILSRYPEFINNYQTLLPQSAKAWRSLGFSEKDRASFFHRHPPLMNISSELLLKGYGFLSQYFSNKELVLLIKNNPRVVLESKHTVKEKIDSMWKKYSHSTLAIAQSEAISRNVDHIEVRHEFLIRAGLFKSIPHHKFLKMQAESDRRRVAVVRDKYFTPGIIVCSSDEKFLSTCSQDFLISAELSTFEEFLLHEKENSAFQETVEIQNEVDFSGVKLPSKTELDDVVEIETDVTTSYSYEENSLEQVDEDGDVSINYNDRRYYQRGGNSFELFNIVDSVDFYF